MLESEPLIFTQQTFPDSMSTHPPWLALNPSIGFSFARTAQKTNDRDSIFSKKELLAFDRIRKSYRFVWIIHVGIETRDYKWSNIAALFHVLLVLVNSKPVSDGVKHDKLSGTFSFSDHVMIMGKGGECTSPNQAYICPLFT